MPDTLRNDLHAMYVAYVDGHVERKLHRRGGGASTDEINAWAQQAHGKWVALYPAAHAYRFGLSEPDYSALADACREFVDVYMSNGDDLGEAVDRVLRALHGDDPYRRGEDR